MIRNIVRKGAAPVTCGLLLFLLLRFILFVGYVPSASMEPTIPEGSLIVGVRLMGELEHWDIIIFLHDGISHVKRIAALPGEVVCIDGQTYTVPESHFFVLGDNSDQSVDSRFWEDPFVPESDVLAKLIWP